MKEVQLGYVVKSKFLIAVLTGFLFLGGLMTAFFSTNTVFALPVGAMGDFYVMFDELEGKGFSLHPQYEESAEKNSGPLIRNKIESATIHGLHIYKDVQLPNKKWFRINITTSQPTEIKGIIQDARVIEANLAFDEMEIAQKNTSKMSALDAFKQNWTHKAKTVTITDAIIQTNYLFQNAVNLPAAQISVEAIDGPIGKIPGDRVPGDGSRHPSGGATDDSGLGGLLPKTATHWLTYVVIGGIIILVGSLFIVIRRKIKADNL